MYIHGISESTRKWVNDKTSSAKKFSITIVVALTILALIFIVGVHLSSVSIAHTLELIQALLIGSTALMGLSGLMIIEIKKVDVLTGLSSENSIERSYAENKIAFLAEAGVYIRWAIALSIVSILFSCAFLICNNVDLMILSLAAFIAQILLFIWGLMSWDLFT